ncbi:helix-turn-helix domain-containing protein [Bradyrhizobium sp. CB1717]|uniref:helix-turn-helix domain-containing protein n=1 Tax=Bradyrhizobium sp. CB1717 TaxID=3039154 RepID=UPI0024B10740|nr:helix-turn-helix domain-containing protein [Bradyrhizobium sp. CB1717]WFU21141.1 helix-turn-helix domain-containing protein [Bradyrhizobium sp. CB1717]
MHPAINLLTKWRLLQAIVADPELDAASKLVATRLLGHCNTKTGRCDPSYQAIADALGYSRRHVIRSIQRLASAGWIQVHRRGRGRQASSNRFEFPWNRAEADETGFSSNFRRAKNAEGAQSAFKMKSDPEEVVAPISSPSASGVTAVSDKDVTNRATAVTSGVTPASPKKGNSKQERKSQELEQAPAKPSLSPAAILFGDCRGYLEETAGLSADQARRLLGKWRQTHRDAAIIEAVSIAIRNEARDPVGFISACLSRSSPSQSVGAMSAIAAIERFET